MGFWFWFGVWCLVLGAKFDHFFTSALKGIAVTMLVASRRGSPSKWWEVVGSPSGGRFSANDANKTTALNFDDKRGLESRELTRS